MKNILKLLIATTLLVTVACKNENTGGVQNAQAFIDYLLLNSPTSTEGDILILKNPTLREGYFIALSVKEGTYFAVSTQYWVEGMTFTEYTAIITANGFVPAFEVSYVGSNRYQDSDGNLYEESSASSKDLEKMASLLETKNNQVMADAFVQNYGLSEERAAKVAKLTSQWTKISKSKSMTNKEIDLFSKELLGVDAKTVVNAQTDVATLELLVNKAASVNQISPEQMQEIVESFTK